MADHRNSPVPEHRQSRWAFSFRRMTNGQVWTMLIALLVLSLALIAYVL